MREGDEGDVAKGLSALFFLSISFHLLRPTRGIQYPYALYKHDNGQRNSEEDRDRKRREENITKFTHSPSPHISTDSQFSRRRPACIVNAYLALWMDLALSTAQRKAQRRRGGREAASWDRGGGGGGKIIKAGRKIRLPLFKPKTLIDMLLLSSFLSLSAFVAVFIRLEVRYGRIRKYS